MYVKVTNGSVDQFPYTVGLLRRDNPNTSFPRTISDSMLQDWGVYTVVQQDIPSYDERTQDVELATTPTLSGDTWTLAVNVVSKTAEQIQQYDDDRAEGNRAARDSLLRETDWWGASDRTMTAEQTAYRQALRDITSHANWPHLEDADWPTKP